MTDLRKTAESLARRGVQALSCDEAELADAIHKALEAARDEALEQCAVRMETWTLPRMVFPSGWEITREDMAAGFRALKSTPQGEPK